MSRRIRNAISVAAALTAIIAVWPGPVPPATAAPGRITSEQVVASFGGSNGAGPMSGVSIGPDGVLYGTTVFGGTHGAGCVFSLTPDGGTYTERVLFSFDGADGEKPTGNVVADPHGDLFGATVIGGAFDGGTVFELVPGPDGDYTETVLHSFAGRDGLQPVGAPVIDASADLFGVTQFGGAGGQGVVYEMTPTAAGYAERVLHSFASTSGQPQAGLTMARDGNLYGTVYGFSEINGFGSVFRVALPRGEPAFTDLYDFHGADGANPIATLTLDDRNGAIFGTTEYGGGGHYGTVFEIEPSAGGYQERVLHSFAAGRDGILPQAPVLLAPDGSLFGTADIGGVDCKGTGCGTVFELAWNGSDYTFHVVHRFQGPPDGAAPQWSGLMAGPGGVLFGTTRSGGTFTQCSDGGPGGVHGCGTVYEISG